MVPGTLALEMVVNREDPGDGDLLGTDVAIVAGGTGNQNRGAHLFAGSQDLIQFFLAQHACMGSFRDGHILLHLASFVHAA